MAEKPVISKGSKFRRNEFVIEVVEPGEHVRCRQVETDTVFPIHREALLRHFEPVEEAHDA